MARHTKSAIKNSPMPEKKEIMAMHSTQGEPYTIPHSGGKVEPSKPSDRTWNGPTPWNSDTTIPHSGGSMEPMYASDKTEMPVIGHPSPAYTIPHSGGTSDMPSRKMSRSEKKYYAGAAKSGKPEGHI